MNIKKILSLALLAGISAAPACALTESEIEANIASLLGQMTLEEKIGQLNQLSGSGYSPQMAGMVKGGAVGSILNETDPKIVNKLQREAVENSRLGIPLIFARDVIHGFKTIFPIPLGQAASWNEALVEEGARIAAEEASSVGIRWTFSPMVDISRDARWGRIAESFGEDPLLSTRLGLAMTKGYQGDDLSKPNTMAACAKHFACYGAAESGKDYNTTWIPEILLREVYLPPFEAQAKAGAATFMCSFNDINGIPSSGNAYLLNDILRKEWGYDGLMVSDWGSIEQMIPHGYSRDLREAARQAAEAGVDVDMESHAYISHLKDLVEKGEIPESRVDELCGNLLRLKYRLGLFENPYVAEGKMNFYQPASLDAARRAVEQSAVLLKNNGTLPLSKNVKKIAVIGPMADAKHDQAGTWVFDLEKERCITPLTSLREIYGTKNVLYAPGLTFSREKDTKGFSEAIKAANEADVVLYFAGEEAVLSGEAHCRTDLTLPGAQKELMAELAKTGKPVVLIVQAGRPLVIGNEADLADAAIFCFHGGTMTGPALANLISGNANFSGKLPVCLPKTSGQMPLYYAHKATGRPASGMTLIDDIPLEAGQTSTGCTAFYLDCGDGPAFPFGYGLSYNRYSYSTPVLSSDTLNSNGEITVSCDVTNNGSMEGTEIVQLYVRDLVGSVVRPVKELKDYRLVNLKPGQTRTVTFTVTPDMLAFYNAQLEKKPEAGEFSIWIAPNSATGESVNFNYVDDNKILSNR